MVSPDIADTPPDFSDAHPREPSPVYLKKLTPGGTDVDDAKECFARIAHRAFWKPALQLLHGIHDMPCRRNRVERMKKKFCRNPTFLNIRENTHTFETDDERRAFATNITSCNTYIIRPPIYKFVRIYKRRTTFL
jgi:hypothetical protein